MQTKFHIAEVTSLNPFHIIGRMIVENVVFCLCHFNDAGYERSMIEVRNLNKSYVSSGLETHVLKGIDLSVGRGEFLSVMGPSGSGKSTLLYLLGGLDAPSGGQILVDGRDISGMPDHEISVYRRRQIGFVFQSYNLVPNLNVEENILLPVFLDGKGRKAVESRLNELLEVIGLPDKRKNSPWQLSGGQQQRIAIARALINQPEILLADEPTGNLDSQSGHDVLQLFQRIHRVYGKTIVQVTHSEEAARCGQRIITLRDGKIYGEGNH